MNPVTPEVRGLVRQALVRAFAGVPGVRIERVSGGAVLLVVATGKVRCRINGKPAAQAEPWMFVHDGEGLIRHRVGGVFVAALHGIDGTLVRSGREHFLIADGALVPIEQRVHRYMLGLRTTQTAPVVGFAV